MKRSDATVNMQATQQYLFTKKGCKRYRCINSWDGTEMSEFHISVPTDVLINDLAIIATLVIIRLVIWFYSKETNRVVGAGVLGVVIIIFIYVSLISPAQTKVVLDDDTLIVNIPQYGHETVKKEEIRRIYVVDIEYDENLRPKSKKFGEGTRSYKKRLV
ncbi:MAG: hypothetical protein U9Q68_12290 [Euryarchaeota archaeon]|nr:hypothetical protein [Euryarchaeota archaeon]